MVEMQVMGLALDGNAKAPILLLREQQSARILPVWIGATEAVAISLALNSIPMPRPLTHDLLLNCIYALNGSVHSVEISALHEGAYRAELVIESKGELLRQDSRPSDAVALALRAAKPILVSREVLDNAGTYRLQALESGSAQFYGPSETPELLATLFTMPDSPKMEDVRAEAPNGGAESGAKPQITVTVTPVRRGEARKNVISIDAAPKNASETHLEDLLRSLDPETKYRM